MHTNISVRGGGGRGQGAAAAGNYKRKLGNTIGEISLKTRNMHDDSRKLKKKCSGLQVSAI